MEHKTILSRLIIVLLISIYISLCNTYRNYSFHKVSSNVKRRIQFIYLYLFYIRTLIYKSLQKFRLSTIDFDVKINGILLISLSSARKDKFC